MKPADLSADQRRLLDQLLADSGMAGQDAPVPRRPGGRTRAPLFFGQERLYFLEQFEPGSPLYTVAGALHLRGRLDVQVLRQSVRTLVDRHEVFRTCFAEDGTEAVIAAPRTVAVGIPVHEVDEADVEERVRRSALAGFDLAVAPLLRVDLLHVSGTDRWVLVVCVHHIAVDGWSLGLLLAELGAVYAALDSGRAPELAPLRLEYSDFAAWRRERLASATSSKRRPWRCSPRRSRRPARPGGPASVRRAGPTVIATGRMSTALGEFQERSQVHAVRGGT